MKKILILFISIIIGINVNAQCTPGDYDEPGLHPDTIQGMPPAVVSEPYEEVVTVVVPKDTTISFGTVQIDSIGVTDIKGMPGGFDYTPNSSTGYWPGDSSGCVLVTGDPQPGDEGVYPVEVDVMVYASGYSAPFTYTGYELEILDSTHVNIQEAKSSVNEVVAFPNPFKEDLTIEFEMNKNAPVEVELFNMVGDVLRQKTINATAGENAIKFNTASLTNGVYFYRFNAGDKIITRKLVKE
ncbi:MAG: T9SS type A sorting domain-containing protein [Bacteroidota bacterium]